MPIHEWKEREGILDDERINLTRLSHMRYMHTDFGEISRFLEDFGMKLLKKQDSIMWWSGNNSEQYCFVVEKGPVNKFLGGAFAVKSYAELEK